MKVLLLGGTGAMGEPLAKILSDKGDEVYVTTRSERSDDKINFIKGDAHNNIFLSETLKGGYDAVIDFMIYNTEEFGQRVEMLLNSTGQYVFFSSSRVYANSEKAIDENSPRLLDVSKDEKYLQTDEYALTKARQENILFQSGTNNWTIIRPYITYNSERLQLGVMEKEKWLYRALHGKSILFAEDIAEHVTTLTYGYDVASAISQLVANKNALGRPINITGQDSLKWRDILDIYLNILEEIIGTRPNVVMLENSNELGERMNNKYQVKYDRLYDRVFDNSLINKLCNDISFIPTEDGLKKCVTEFIENANPFKNISWRYEGWVDKICKENEPISDIEGWKNKCKYILTRIGCI